MRDIWNEIDLDETIKDYEFTKNAENTIVRTVTGKTDLEQGLK